jgi:potassium-transporting ATPase potassium-binding subunit
MPPVEIAQILLFLAVLALITPFLGEYMARVYQGQRVFLSPILRPVEVGLYRVSGIREEQESSWVGYVASVLAFTVVGLVVTYILLRIQAHLPLNPDGQTAVGPFLSLNSAISFTSNTNWQNYGGETTMSYLSQMLSVARNNFTSPAIGMGIAIAFIRGFSRQSSRTLGSFWVDLTRSMVYILLPLAFVLTCIYIAQGIPQTLGGAVPVKTLEGVTQTISRGPVATQEAFKELGDNGAGFFNVNSAHPFENPTPLTNIVEMLAATIIPFGLIWTFGRMVGSIKQGLVVGAVMATVFVVGIGVTTAAEVTGNPAFGKIGISQAVTGTSPGGNMEGKEVRFGPVGSAAYETTMTGTGTGAADSALDSFTPVGGLVPLVLVKIGSITPGNDGCGLYGLLIFVILAVFVAGLMVGRTPDYLGKRIQRFDMKMIALSLLILPIFILSFAALSSVIKAGTSAILNPGPHGLTEIIYAFASTVANNGSSFGGLSTNTNYYNVVLGVAMWLGRFLFMVPVLALAASLASKRRLPVTAGSLPTDTVLFSVWVLAVLVVVGALTMFPVLSLAPIAEHFRMAAGILSN